MWVGWQTMEKNNNKSKNTNIALQGLPKKNESKKDKNLSDENSFVFFYIPLYTNKCLVILCHAVCRLKKENESFCLNIRFLPSLKVLFIFYIFYSIFFGTPTMFLLSCVYAFFNCVHFISAHFYPLLSLILSQFKHFASLFSTLLHISQNFIAIFSFISNPCIPVMHCYAWKSFNCYWLYYHLHSFTFPFCFYQIVDY